jgi:hypothetical protein
MDVTKLRCGMDFASTTGVAEDALKQTAQKLLSPVQIIVYLMVGADVVKHKIVERSVI